MKLRLLLCLCTPLAAIAAGQNAYAAEESGTAEASVIPSMTLTKTRDLDFGRFIPSSATGRVRINARTGARNTSASVIPIGNDFSSALFNGVGAPNEGVTISVATPSVVLTRTTGGATMTLDRFRVSAEGGGNRTLPRNYNIPADGTIDFAIGGRLRVGANQAAGLYTGSFDITMEYQ